MNMLNKLKNRTVRSVCFRFLRCLLGGAECSVIIYTCVSVIGLTL